jgi:hypothetical protein
LAEDETREDDQEEPRDEERNGAVSRPVAVSTFKCTKEEVWVRRKRKAALLGALKGRVNRKSCSLTYYLFFQVWTCS